VTLLGQNTYTGATTITGGVLAVNGSIASSSLTTVGNGAMLTGNGTVGNTIVNSGALFAPGDGTAASSIAVAGNLALQSGALYLLQLNQTTASFANVTGTAALGGAAVNAVFAGASVLKRYTILSAAGGVSGSFGSLNTNLPANLQTALSYDANHAFLDVNLNFAASGGLTGNQRAVGNALGNFFNGSGSLPLVYATLAPGGLAQASGETATGSQQATFNAMTQFMAIIGDPFIDGRGSAAGPATAAPAFADDEQANAYAASGRKRSAAERDTFAMLTKAPPAQSDDRRWSVWAAGFGGSQTTDGNAALGSNNTTSRISGTAIGADYLVSPNTLAGFALAGGGTNFSVANGGTGRSDLFQAGAFIRHNVGPTYLSAALAYGWQDISTARTVSIAGIDNLSAEFNANAWSGRAEGGYRFVMPFVGGIGITPYAAAQFTAFELPAYAERVVSGANTFALAYGAKSITDTRSELGLRADKSFAMPGSVLTLRGRFAWAHDFNPDRSIAATFQALPGASFVVGGAAQASDAALTTASIERRWTSGFSLAGTFEGEFSSVTRSYAGKGVVRYAW
jgi:autotransporter-associated beta strand protein